MTLQAREVWLVNNQIKAVSLFEAISKEFFNSQKQSSENYGRRPHGIIKHCELDVARVS